MQPFGHNRYGPKIGGLRPPPLWGRGKWVPIYHNVARAKAYLHAKFHLKLIRPTVWPQCTNVADMTVRQTGQNRQRTDSIEQTVLQTVAKKLDSSTCIKFLLMIPKILCGLCLIFFSHMIFKCEVTIKYITPKSYMEFNFY